MFQFYFTLLQSRATSPEHGLVSGHTLLMRAQFFKPSLMSQTGYLGHNILRPSFPLSSTVLSYRLSDTLSLQPSALLRSLNQTLVDHTDFQGAFLQTTAQNQTTQHATAEKLFHSLSALEKVPDIPSNTLKV